MITIDYLIIAIVLISVMVGFFRGFFPEIVSIATWVVALFAAWNFGGLVEPYLQGKLGSIVVEMWTAKIIVFVVAMILGGLIAQLVSLLIDKSGLSGTDRMLGLVFGLVRGGVILGVLVILGQMLGFTKEPWWPQSQMIPIGETIADTLRVMMPDNLTDYLDLSAEPTTEPQTNSPDEPQTQTDSPDEPN